MLCTADKIEAEIITKIEVQFYVLVLKSEGLVAIIDILNKCLSEASGI